MDTQHEANQIIRQVKQAALRAKGTREREQLYTLAKNQLPSLPPAEYERAIKRIADALEI